jgi:hypothetical protein
VSVDGYFDRPNQDLDWFVLHDEFFAYVDRMLASIDGILLGRTRKRFLDGLPDRLDLTLTDTHVSGSGVIAHCYEPTGATA